MTLIVIIEAKPKPVVTWYREGCIIENSPDYQISETDKQFSLVIAEVFPEDSGVFKCVASNPEGSTTCEARLLVEREFNSFLASVGDDLELCILGTSLVVLHSSLFSYLNADSFFLLAVKALLTLQ